MMHLVVGTDTYGRVKVVGKTAIVTTFSMFQLLPVEPLKSYYVWGPTKSRTEGIPFLAQVQKVTIRGVPLACVDRHSVAIAYLRAILAVMVMFGFMPVFVGLMMNLSGHRMDDFAVTVVGLGGGCLATGAAVGVLTYVVPTTSRRERAIRTYCGEMLGVCIDPAWVAPEAADAIRVALPRLKNLDREAAAGPRSEYLRELIRTRCDDAAGAKHDSEARTDELLDQLRHLDRVGPTQAADGEPSGLDRQ